MKIVFNEDFGRVWTDNLTPCVFTLIERVPSSSAHAVRFFKAQIDLTQSLQKKFKEAYLISDFSETTTETRELMCHYYMEFLPQLVKNKISYVAFVCPQNAFDTISKEKQEKLSHYPLGVFPDFTEALAMVNLKRSMVLSQRLENSY